MAASSSLVCFLALVCLAAGGPLPVKEGTTVGSLLNTTLALWEGLPQPYVFLGQVNSSLSSWSEAFVEALQPSMRLRILDPFTAAYNKEFNATDVGVEDEDLSMVFNFTVQLEEESFLAYFSKAVEGPINELYADMNATTNAITAIVVDLPNWMDTKGILKVDLSKVDFNRESLFHVLMTNTKVPEYHLKNFQLIQKSVDSISSRAAAMGQCYAKSVKKMLRYLKTQYPVTALFLG